MPRKGVKLFATIDHSGEAASGFGMEMHPTKLLIFGNPKAGTPVMLAAPGIAIDLPLKALIWEDASGKTWLSYNDAQYLKTRHNVPDELIKNLTAAEGLLKPLQCRLSNLSGVARTQFCNRFLRQFRTMLLHSSSKVAGR